jgi:hypothetical protein
MKKKSFLCSMLLLASAVQVGAQGFAGMPARMGA